MKRDMPSEARGRWPSILTALGVDPKFLRNVHGPCPFCGGTDRYRFDDKGGDGLFYCSKCGAGNGFDIVMRLHNVDFKGAVKLIEPILPTARTVSVRPRRDPEKLKSELKKMWEQAKRIAPADEAGRYIASRGLPFPPHALCLRTHQKLAYRDSEGITTAFFPALLVAVQDKSGRMSAIHRTWLRDGQKAPVAQPKKTLGVLSPGCAARLFPAENGVLGVAEGFETALAAWKLTGVPTWAMLNAGQMEKFEWPKDVNELVIFADKDSSFTGQKAAYTLAFRAKSKGLRVDVMMPRGVDTDWCDYLNATQKKENEHGKQTVCG